MKPQLKKISLFLILVLDLYSVYSQTYTQESLQKTYWNYRDRFRKYFIQIGIENGKSIPFEGLKKDFSVTPINSNLGFPDINGQINYGDANITHGFYLAVLATEYKLLITSKKIDWEAMEACRNEIYYALSAINRIDKYSDKYFNEQINPNTQPMDGFLTRGDPTKDYGLNAFNDNAGFHKNYKWVHSDLFSGINVVSKNEYFKRESVKVPVKLYGQTIYTQKVRKMIEYRTVTAANGSIFNVHTDWNKIFKHPILGYNSDREGCYGDFAAEMSQDHYIGLLFGLYFVHKFVNNDYVKPTSSDPGFKLLDETYWIIRRLTDHFSSNKEADVYGGTDDFYDESDVEKSLSNFIFKPNGIVKIFGAPWVMTNPYFPKVVERGGRSFSGGFSYPISKITNEVMGYNRWQMASGYFRYQNSKTQDEKKADIPNQEIRFNNYFAFQILNQNRQRSFGDGVYKGKNIFNFNMGLKLATMSSLFSRDQIFDAANYQYQKKGLMWYYLYTVLKNESNRPNHLSYTFFDNVPCGGTLNHDKISFKDLSLENKWVFENKFNFYSGSEGDHETDIKTGEFNGLDFMLMYNIFRLYYAPSETTEIGKTFINNACPCENSVDMVTDALRDISGNLINSLTTSFTTEELNKSYRSFNIPAPEWLTHNITISGSGALNVEGDLWVCNSTTTLQSSGKLTFTETPHDYPRYIYFKSGSTLEIKSGGILQVENNTRVIIEEGAKIIYHQGARIILNGANAELKFNQGQLKLKPGAEFKIEAGANGRGYVHVHHNWVPNDVATIVCEDKTAKFILEGTYSNDWQYHNDLLLKITGNIGLNTDWNLKNFSVSKGFIAIDNGSQLVTNAESSNFLKCNVNTLSNSSIDYKKHNGIEIPGRINNFEEVKISNGNTGIRYYTRGGQENLKLVKVTTLNCNIGVMLAGGGFDISSDSKITGHNRAIYAIGTSNFSIVRNSEIGIGGDGVGERVDALYFQGSRNLFAWKNLIRHGISGVNIADAKGMLKCNIMNQNNTNLLWFNSPIITMKNGFNSFDYLCNQHIYGYGNTWFDTKDNYNKYVQPVAYNNYYMFDITYSMNSPWEIGMPSYTDWSNSCFYQGGGAPINLGTFPSNKYHLEVLDNFDITNPNSEPLELKVNTNLSLTSIGTSINTGCQEMHITGPVIVKDHESGEGYYPPSNPRKREMNPGINNIKPGIFAYPVIYTNQYQTDSTKPLSAALVENYIRLYERTMPAYDSAIEELGNILTENASDDSLSLSPYMEDMYFLYEMFNNAYANVAFYRDSADTLFLPSFEKISPYYEKIDTVFQKLWEQSEDSNSFWFYRKYELAKDWSQVHRIANQQQKAIDVLEMAIDSINNTIEKQGLGKWICINEFEMTLKTDSTLSWDSAVALFPCLFETSAPEDSIITTDTTLYYCNWSDSVLGYKNGARFETIEYLESIQMTSPQNKFIRVRDSGTYLFSEGIYKLLYFDSTTYTRTRLNLIVVADSVEIECSDTSIFICDRNIYGISSNYTYTSVDTLPYTITDDSTSIEAISNLLDFGSYTIEHYDTNNCKIYKLKLLVIPDSMSISYHDTTITTCLSNDGSIETYFPAYSGMIYSVEEIPNSIVEEYYDTVVQWKINLDFIDTLNCNIIRYNVRFINSYEIINRDTTITFCLFLDSTYSFTNPYRFNGFVYSALQVSPDTFEVTENELYSGEYIVNLFDTLNCRFERVNLTLNHTSPELVAMDSAIVRYCTHVDTFTSIGVVSNLQENNPYLIKKITSDTTYEIEHDSVLVSGKYIVVVYDTGNCKIFRTYLEIIPTEPDTIVDLDTLFYSCQNQFNYYPYPIPCQLGKMFDNNDSIIDPMGDHYDLNPQNQNYEYHCYDTSNCQVIITSITFEDLLAIPSTCDNYLDGSYNRSEGDNCCFVNISEIICEGDTMQVGDEIEIFTMDSLFLYSSTIDSYNPWILGFRFCPPYWDTDPEHINDWYTLVFKKSTCLVCCLNFRCDSMAFESMTISNDINSLQNKFNNFTNSPKSNKIYNIKNKESFSLVDSSELLINIYPNPANSKFNIRILGAINPEITLTIYDQTGKAVYNKHFTTDNGSLNMDISLNDIVSGVYTIYIPELNSYYKLVIIK